MERQTSGRRLAALSRQTSGDPVVAAPTERVLSSSPCVAQEPGLEKAEKHVEATGYLLEDTRLGDMRKVRNFVDATGYQVDAATGEPGMSFEAAMMRFGNTTDEEVEAAAAEIAGPNAPMTDVDVGAWKSTVLQDPKVELAADVAWESPGVTTDSTEPEIVYALRVTCENPGTIGTQFDAFRDYVKLEELSLLQFPNGGFGLATSAELDQNPFWWEELATRKEIQRFVTQHSGPGGLVCVDLQLLASGDAVVTGPSSGAEPGADLPGLAPFDEPGLRAVFDPEVRLVDDSPGAALPEAIWKFVQARLGEPDPGWSSGGRFLIPGRNLGSRRE